MKKNRIPALVVAAALSTSAIAPLQAEAQPEVPNVAQLQKQFDQAVQNALKSLWAPYDQLIRTFPQLKPFLDPIVNQFLPPRSPAKLPKTNAASLRDAAQKRRTNLSDDVAHNYTRAPYIHDPALDRVAYDFLTGRANEGHIPTEAEGNSVDLPQAYIQWNAYTGKPTTYTDSSGQKRTNRFSKHTLEAYMRSEFDLIEGPDGKIDGSLSDVSLSPRMTRIGTAVIYRDGVIYSAVAYK